MTADPTRPAFHAMPRDRVLAWMESNADGLSSETAAARLAEHGPNALPAARRRHPALRFLAHFNNTLIYFLLAASLATLVLGHIVDSIVILAVVVVNAIVGFIQEGRAEKALDAIGGLVAPQAHVLRDGLRQTVPAAQIAPGDIVLLEAGDRVPADLRLLWTRALLIDEALLTGESVAAEKSTAPVGEAAALGDRACMAYSGSLVATGQATGVAVATGARTEIGRISALLGQVQVMETPLLRQINRFGTRFTLISIVAAALLFAFAVLVRDYSGLDALVAVVALAVGVVPEGLPAVITITLAIGVQRMASRNAAIRQLPAVETLGATSVICSDKTGTLTRNEMTVHRVETAAGRLWVSGAGYAPQGELTSDPPAPDAVEDAAEDARRRRAAEPVVLAGLLCGDARLFEGEGGWAVSGDPMEGALVALACKAGFDPDRTHAGRRRIDVIPFDPARRYMAVLCLDAGGGRSVHVKGAPDVLLDLCRSQMDGEAEAPLDRAYWEDRIAQAAADGERVLGFAMRAAPDDLETLDPGRIGEGLIFLGLAGFIDPPRPEAMEAIASCRSAGIAVKMITGDHGATAAAIARQLGIAEEPAVLTGRELDGISDADLPRVALDTPVFARTDPEHKLRIVRALQSTGAVVAMTGDGVNDAPSLKQADVGVSMGLKGTDAAKEASKMVLLDDNFASIVAAVREGRVVYDNIRKVVSWTLPTNGGEALTVVVAILFGFALPMAPIQILWINLVLTATLGLVLAFEPAEPGVMARPPRRADQGLLSPWIVWRIVLVSVLFTIAALGVFFYALAQGAALETARTMVVNLLVVLQIFYLFNVRYLHMTSFNWRGFLGTPAVLGAVAIVVLAQLAFTYLPAMNEVFGSRPLALGQGLLVLAVGLALMVLLEVEKAVIRRLGVFE